MNWIIKFADDTKIFGKVNTASDGLKLQKDLQTLIKWSVDWQMQFNVKKYKVMYIGKKNIDYEYSTDDVVLESVEAEKDLGVMISHDLNTSNHQVIGLQVIGSSSHGILYSYLVTLLCKR